MTTAADMERVGGRCENCDRPLATKQDAKDIPPGEGEHLCWGACEPEDWRARALKAEAEVERFRNAVREKERLELEAVQELDEARAEVERLRADKDRLHGILRDIEYDKDKVAERQRKLCQTYLRDRAQEVLYDKGSERLADGLLAAAQMIEYAPLVTEGEP